MQQKSNQLNISGFKRWWLHRLVDFQSLHYGKPDKRLKLIAITGTAGKTSTANILHHILLSTNPNVGLIASNGVWAGKQQILPSLDVDAMGADELYEALAELAKAKVEWVIVEIGYKQLSERSYYKLKFENALLTNISPIDDELYAKLIFSPIEQTKQNGLIVINGDDAAVPWLVQQANMLVQQLYAAWCKKDHLKVLQQATNGTSFNYMEQTFQTKLFTDMSLENLQLAIRMSLQFVQPAQAVAAVTSYAPNFGRMQLVSSSPYSAIVDKAMVASGATVLQRCLTELSKFKSAEARLIVVIDGVLAQNALEALSKYAKVLIVAPADPGKHDVTNINTRLFSLLEDYNVVLLERFTSKEEFQAIDKGNFVEKIERVVKNGDLPMISFDENSSDGRLDAMKLALAIAKLGDVVIFLGKGDDRELDFGEMHYDWDEAAEVAKLMH